MRSGIQAGTAGRGGGVGGEALLNGWGRPRDVISCCVGEHRCQITSRGKNEPPEVLKDWEFNRGEEGLGHQ